MQTSATDVFVSYKAEDRPRVKPLVSALEAEGFSVWWDAHVGGGTHWREDIEEHLNAAKCVVVTWTKRSVGREGDFVRDEASRAQRRGVYLPICLDAVDPPLGFGEVQAVSLRGWRGDRSDPRFLTLADAVRKYINGESYARHATSVDKGRLSRRTAVIGGAAVGTAAIVGASGWFLRKPGVANAKRIAVLPFANLSGGADQAYFGEGIAEELRGALSRIGLEVIGRASSDAVKDMDTRAAAAKLSVANILTGSVRRSPDMVRISAQLLDGSDGSERWRQTYDRGHGDAIKIQTDIAENVVQALSITLGAAVRAALTLGSTADPVAQDLVLQAVQTYAWATSFDEFRRALALAEAAIVRDPRYSGAYGVKSTIHRIWANDAVASAEASEHRAQAYAAARKGIELAPTWGRAYVPLLAVELVALDFPNALQTGKRAVSLAPEDPLVLGTAADAVGFLQNIEGGIRLVERSIALDPLRAGGYGSRAFMLIFARRYAEAVEVARKALFLQPKEISWHVQIGDALLLLGRADSANAEYELANDTPFRKTRFAILAARTGNPSKAQKLLADIKRENGAATSYQHAEIYAQLGDIDHSFAELEAGVQWKDGALQYLKTDPFLDPIRGDPRYFALLRRLNFP